MSESTNVTTDDKSTKMKQVQKPKLVGFSFYHEGKEYVIQAVDQKEARALFQQLINKHGKRNSKT